MKVTFIVGDDALAALVERGWLLDSEREDPGQATDAILALLSEALGLSGARSEQEEYVEEISVPRRGGLSGGLVVLHKDGAIDPRSGPPLVGSPRGNGRLEILR